MIRRKTPFIALFLLFSSLCSQVFGAASTPVSGQPLKLEQGKISANTSSWVKVNFSKTYTKPVILCTPVYDSTREPMVPRIRISTTYFEIKLKPAKNSSTNTAPTMVQYLVLESGRYTKVTHGIALEAGTISTTLVDAKNSWTGTNIVPGNIYKSPVVLGQIQTSNDNGDTFQTFWACGRINTSAPDPTNIKIGRHVGEDSIRTRSAESIGYIIAEAGSYAIDGLIFELGRTENNIDGITAGGRALNTSRKDCRGLLLSQNTMNNNDGSFPVIVRDATSSDALLIGVDEDQLADSERNHSGETLSTMLVLTSLPTPTFAPTSPIVFDMGGGEVKLTAAVAASKIYYTINGQDPTTSSSLYSTPIKFKQNTTLKTRAFLTGYTASPVSSTTVQITSVVGQIAPGFIYTKLNWPNNSSQDSQVSLDTVPDLKNFSPRETSIKTGLPLGKINMPAYTIVEINAYINIATAGTYKFYLPKTPNACAKLFIDNMDVPLISRPLTATSADNGQVSLIQGLHKIKIQAVNNIFDGFFEIYYSSSAIAKTPIPASLFSYSVEQSNQIKARLDSDGDTLSDDQEKNLGSAIFQIDGDGDSIADNVELQLGTSLVNADTDGDGINDFLEAFVFHSLANDDLGSLTLLQNIAPANTVAKAGRWDIDGHELFSRNYRGEVQYDFSLTGADMPLLKIKGKENGLYPIGHSFPLAVWVDGVYISRQVLQSRADYRLEKYGMRFKSHLSIPAPGGLYQFELESNDGSQMLIDGVMVVDHNGTHSMSVKSGSIQLGPGLHSIEVNYFNHLGGDGLNVRFTAPGASKRNLSGEILGEVVWDYYEVATVWTTMPNFTMLSPVKSGVSNNIGLNLRQSVKSGEVFYLLPWLNAGQHRVKILWDNGIYNKSLRLQEINLYTVNGADLNGNQRRDWIDNKTAFDCTVAPISNSKTSPAQLEGKSLYPELMSLNSTDKIKPASTRGWYANVALNASSPTTVNVSFENGLKTVSRTITWDKTDIFSSASPILLRSGSSLLLHPHATTGASGNATVQINTESFTLTSGSPLAYTFQNVGDYEVTARSRLSNGQTVSATILVQARNLDLPDNIVVGLVGSERKIQLPSISSIVYDPDQRLHAWYETDRVTGNNNFEFAVSLDKEEQRVVVARLGADGPILDHMVLEGMSVYGAGQTWLHVESTLVDGTKKISLGLVAYPIRSDVRVHVDIYLPGIVHEDGTASRILSSSNFNTINEAGIYMYKTSSARITAACHHLTVFTSNGELIGRAY